MIETKRSTPLRPAIWMTGVLVWATVVGLFLHIPTWSGIFLCGLTGVSFAHYLVTYIYLLEHDRESLRREKVASKEGRLLDGGASVVDSEIVTHRDKV